MGAKLYTHPTHNEEGDDVMSLEENKLCRVIVCDLKDAIDHLPETLLELGFYDEKYQLLY